MPIIQGVENVDVAIPMRSLEAELVGKEESRLIAKLNAEGKRVVRIDHQKRAGGFAEWSGTHATITALWEADTEDSTYKRYISTQKAKERQEREEKEASIRKKQEAAIAKGAAKREGQTNLFWERHKKERLQLKQELEWLQGLSKEEIGSNKQYVKDRMQIIYKILDKSRPNNMGYFTDYEKVQMAYYKVSRAKLSNPSKYNEIVTEYPILKNTTALAEGKPGFSRADFKALIILTGVQILLIFLFWGVGNIKWADPDPSTDWIFYLILGFFQCVMFIFWYVGIKTLPLVLENTSYNKKRFSPYKKALKQANIEIDNSIVVEECKAADEKATSIKNDIVHEEIKAQPEKAEVKLPIEEIIKSKYRAALELQQNARDLEGYKKAANAFEELMSPVCDYIISTDDVVRRYTEVQAKIDELVSAQESN